MKKKLPAKKRSVTKKSTISRKKASKTFWEQYNEQRELFYVHHRFGRVLLGLFIVSFALFLAILYTNIHKKIVIGQALVEEDVPSEIIQSVIKK